MLGAVILQWLANRNLKILFAVNKQWLIELTKIIYMKKLIIIGFLVFIVVSESIDAKDLLQAKTSWDGGEIFYPQGQAEISSAILRIEEHQETRYHCHPVVRYFLLNKK